MNFICSILLTLIPHHAAPLAQTSHTGPGTITITAGAPSHLYETWGPTRNEAK